MKNKFFVVIFLLGGCLWMGWSSQTSFKNKPKYVHSLKSGGEATTSPPSSRESAKQNENIVIKGNIDEAKTEYLEKLNNFRRVANEYNKKMMSGEINNEDKIAFAKAERASWEAYENLARHTNEELKKLKDN